MTTATPDINIVDGNGNMTFEMQVWVEVITELQTIIGTGSPENVVEAKIGRQYMDDAGTAGSILYVKKLASIGGDKTQGWILV